MTQVQGLQVSYEPLTNADSLAQEWLGLERKARPNVFLSWQWIGVWLAAYTPKAWVLRVYDQSDLVGLGVVVAVMERRHGVLTSRCLRLHQTGFNEQDQIWIEYNGFLTAPGYSEAVAQAGMAYLIDYVPEWEEFVVGAIDDQYAKQLARVSGLRLHTRWEAPCYGVSLAGLREQKTPYLDTLSRNTRHQIRRAHRLYANRGTIRLVRPTTLADAHQMFADIGPRHLERWGTGRDESGFANPDFVRFHQRLIDTHWDLGGVDLVSIMAGTETVASFYNLIYEDQVYFYLGGLQVEADNRLKPGLLGHTLCIEDYERLGFAYYDFMGGEERYKGQLGSLHQHLVQIALQRDLFKFKVEQAARHAKNQWLAPKSPQWQERKAASPVNAYKRVKPAQRGGLGQ